jgi:hypothetical protein
LETNGIVPEQVKHFDKSFGSQVRQFDDIVHCLHLEGFNLSGVNPTAQGHLFVVTSRFIELSHVKHFEILFGSQVSQLESIEH